MVRFRDGHPLPQGEGESQDEAVTESAVSFQQDQNPQRNVSFSRLGCTSLRISNQSIFAFNDVRTNSERIAVHAPKVTESFGSKLDRHNINEKLPRAWNLGNREDQISRRLGKVLSDQHDLSSELMEVGRDRQILTPHALGINPQTETHPLRN